MALSVTQNKTVHRSGDTPLPNFTEVGRVGTHVDWTTSSGTLSVLTGDVTVLTPLNRTELITVTALDKNSSNVTLSTVIKSVQVYGTFPLQPNYPYDVEFDDKTLVSIAEDGTAVFRVKSPIRRSWQLSMPNRPFTEYSLLNPFYQYHKKFREFYYYDLAINELILVRFDSSLKVTPIGPDQFTMSCVVKEI